MHAPSHATPCISSSGARLHGDRRPAVRPAAPRRHQAGARTHAPVARRARGAAGARRGAR
eukprot:scaffold13145_cov69-Phaeocystis_antarctica.AAC.5